MLHTEFFNGYCLLSLFSPFSCFFFISWLRGGVGLHPTLNLSLGNNVKIKTWIGKAKGGYKYDVLIHNIRLFIFGLEKSVIFLQILQKSPTEKCRVRLFILVGQLIFFSIKFMTENNKNIASPKS